VGREGGARDRGGLLVGRRHEDVPEHAEAWRPAGQAVADAIPLGGLPVGGEEDPALLAHHLEGRGGEPEAEQHVVALLAEPGDRGGVGRRVPQRRVRALVHRHVQLDLLARRPLGSGAAEPAGLHRLDDRREQLLEPLRRVRRGQPEHAGLDR
jgi:hypothetical protein